MIAVLAPAKNMRAASLAGLVVTRPRYRVQTNLLAKWLRDYSPWELESLFHISPELALRTYRYFQDFDWKSPGTPALLAYQGLAFHNVAPGDFSLDDFAFAGEHLRIFSAFYGLLRPADGISPYRLDLNPKRKFKGQTLYQFWGDRFYRDLIKTGQPVINLSSAEFFGAVTPYLTGRDRFLTCRFLVTRRGRTTCLATTVKMARGQMVRHIIKNRLTRPEELTGFDWDGYRFAPHLSDELTYTFVQP